MWSSPTAKSTEKNPTRVTGKVKFANFGGQLDGKNNELKTNLKLSEWMSYPKSQMESCLVCKKRITKRPISQQKANLWNILEALAPSGRYKRIFQEAFRK